MNTNQKKGVTIVELLTVVALLSVLFALLIPQVRLLTRDRAIRESARVVGSTVAEATNKARVDGFAGIELVRNENVSRTVGSNPIFYACYEIYQLRQPPSYVGNSLGDTARVTNISGTQITVTIPAPANGIDTSSGFLRLNHSKAMYPITGGSGGALTCQVPPNYEPPPLNVPLPFELIRPPVRRESSRVEVPRGYMVNLNYSGPVDSDDVDGTPLTWTRFSQSPSSVNESVFIVFDSTGGVDRIFPNGAGGGSFRPSGTVRLCIAPDEIKHTYGVNATESDDMIENGTDVLDDPRVMWVTVNYLNGSVVVAENAVPQTPYASNVQAARMIEAYAISGDRVSARQ